MWTLQNTTTNVKKPKQFCLVQTHEDNHPQNPTQNRLPKYGSQSETMTNTCLWLRTISGPNIEIDKLDIKHRMPTQLPSWPTLKQRKHKRTMVRTWQKLYLDNTFDDTVAAIHGDNIYRKDRNANGGGVAVYIQNHIPVKLRDDLMLKIIWIQVHLPHLKPILGGSCYRPPSANSHLSG